MRDGEVEAARRLITEASEFAVISHERPDGDAVGSMLALTRSLELAGKNVTPVLVDGVPSRFQFLAGAANVVRSIPKENSVLVAIDCSDLPRMGTPKSAAVRPPDLNIDHHATNPHFGRINLVRSDAAATAEVLFELAGRLGLPMDTDVATSLLLGLVTDTIGFRTSNTSPRVLRIAAQLMEMGADLADIYDRGLSRQTLNAARYWGIGLSRLEHNNGLVWATLRLEDRRQAAYPGRDDADLINFLTTIEDALVAVVLVEQSNQKTKVSWRSRPGLDVSRLAAQYGGGGHEQAAGAMVDGDLDSVTSKVVREASSLLHGSPGTEP
jgi:phosphoesterase RecJ-like protein